MTWRLACASSNPDRHYQQRAEYRNERGDRIDIGATNAVLSSRFVISPDQFVDFDKDMRPHGWRIIKKTDAKQHKIDMAKIAKKVKRLRWSYKPERRPPGDAKFEPLTYTADQYASGEDSWSGTLRWPKYIPRQGLRVKFGVAPDEDDRFLRGLLSTIAREEGSRSMRVSKWAYIYWKNRQILDCNICFFKAHFTPELGVEWVKTLSGEINND